MKFIEANIFLITLFSYLLSPYKNNLVRDISPRLRILEPNLRTSQPTDQPNTTTRVSLPNLNQPLQRTNHGQNNISYIASIIWNKLSNCLKTSDNSNTYKHRVQEHFFQRIGNVANNIYRYF